jgi:MinD superfamily P-loop ATPase
MIQEIAVISGKGGTGKTTLLLSMLPYFDDVVIADCDVDAPDVKILLGQDIIHKEPFIGFQRPEIDEEKCIKCGLCYAHCRFHAISDDITIKNGSCEGCGVCEFICPHRAITMRDHEIGTIYYRNTHFGTMVDARLIPGEESSGKLVSEVRSKSKQLAQEQQKSTILIDGSPGVACNVISTITGVSKALIVTEPTVSGLHDLKRVLKLSELFSVQVDVVINKYDLGKGMTREIESFCETTGINVVLKIPFDTRIVNAIAALNIPSTVPDIPFFTSPEWYDFIAYMTNGETA